MSDDQRSRDQLARENEELWRRVAALEADAKRSLAVSAEFRHSEEAWKTLDEQFLAAQKVEALACFAGGIAHDFNNIISVVLGYVGFALEGLPEGSQLRADLLEVEKAGERAAALTRQILAFSRKQVARPQPLDVGLVARNLDKMLRRLMGEDVELVLTLAPGLGLTLADPGQIEQVLMNLAANARDAMAEGGKLTIEIANVELGEEDVARGVSTTVGPYVQIAVTDTGCGMGDQVRARLFEPFFTTKAKGTGLGLSTVLDIVRQNCGSLSVSSEPGKGTTVRIYLPREVAPSAGAASDLMSRAVGKETILVVEDEEPVRALTTRILRSSGYTVVAAANGSEALSTCRRHQGEIDLVVTDVVMPQMNGRVFVGRLAVWYVRESRFCTCPATRRVRSCTTACQTRGPSSLPSRSARQIS